MEDNNPSIKEEKLNYQIDGTEYFNYVYYNASNNEKRPGIIVVDEWWGLTDYGKKRARDLANLGYISMVVDMYGNEKTVEDPQNAGKLASVIYKEPSLAKKYIDAAIEHLKKYSQTDPSKIGAIGYCFGGFVVLNAAKLGSDLKGVVSFHGGLEGAKPDKEKMKGAWNLFGMRSIDTVMKKTAPQWWYNFKIKKIDERAHREIKNFQI